jgi:poly-beta-1,6-N-acetyl-D-glucosamine synthase
MTIVGITLLLLIAYTYVGYPLLVALWSRARPCSVSIRPDFEPTVSVCMTVHNGAAYLLQKLESLAALDYPPDKLEILVYSDGCTDLSEHLKEQLSARGVRLLCGPTRRGKPTGLNRLRTEATGEVLVMTDVRQTLSPRALRALLELLSDPNIGCVSGSLVLAGNTGAGAYWHYERFIRGSEARLGGMVGVSGSLYAIRREDFHELPDDILLDDMFIPLRIVDRGRRIALATQAEAYDHAYADEQEFSRKVRTLAGNYQLFAKLPWLLMPGKNPVWFQLVSHKLLRLLCPFALLGLLGTSVWLASFFGPALPGVSELERSFWQGLALAQLAFYGLAVCGARAGRVGALSRTFVVLNAAAVVGLWRFLRKSQAVAW